MALRNKPRFPQATDFQQRQKEHTLGKGTFPQYVRENWNSKCQEKKGEGGQRKGEGKRKKKKPLALIKYENPIKVDQRINWKT